ncbi:MAG: alpha/beta hydrolase [Elainella sp. C42_A2020_010]|nr:alpha/beta hydrolase [Elainella sp. C42_A2020_010]
MNRWATDVQSEKSASRVAKDIAISGQATHGRATDKQATDKQGTDKQTTDHGTPSANSYSVAPRLVRFARSHWLHWAKLILSIGLLPPLLDAGATIAAERITISYGLLERSIRIDALEQYAADGTISSDLRDYLRYLNDAQQEQLRQALVAPVNLGVVPVTQFLYTEQGEILLRRLGELVRTDSNLSGFYAIRSALILAANDPQGLTMLNVLREFPLSNIRIDLNRTLQLLSDLQRLIQQTQEAAALVAEQSLQEAELEAQIAPLNRAPQPDLQNLGSFGWQVVSIQLNDISRNRQFPVDLYLPQTRNSPVLQAPVVVISHGLGSDRSSYAYLAKQLASYGFAVAVPEHPGSNAQQLQALIAGTASQVTAPAEFIDRPLDIKYLLDRLTQLNQTDPQIQDRLNLEQVGVVGQSFGGYTALALAGGRIDLQQLQLDCDRNDPLNLSLLLQCRALELPQPLSDLYDERVKAIVAINSIGSSLIGAADFSDIQIPVMLMSGSADTIAPALIEQIRPFTWLATPNKYLVLLQGGTHFSTIDVPNPTAADVIPLPSEIIGPDPKVAQAYLKALSVAFFQTHLAQNPDYRFYLGATYAQSISNQVLPISLVQSLTLLQIATNAPTR